MKNKLNENSTKNSKFVNQWGVEFTNNQFIFHLQQQGIIHQFSCPYTPKQNNTIEQCHCTIQKLGMMMEFHSGVPKHFWDEAFATTTFLINKIRTAIFDLQSPFSILQETSPNYHSFHVFGSKYYPYTRDRYKTKQIRPQIFTLFLFGL